MIALLLLGLGALGVVAAKGASDRKAEMIANQEALAERKRQIALAEAKERARLKAAAERKAAQLAAQARRPTNAKALVAAKNINAQINPTSKLQGLHGHNGLMDLNGESYGNL
jgi:F0F1-type ATP synthase membrane subunit b/b'